MIIVGADAILAAQIVPVKGPGTKTRYMAMISVSKGKDKRGADKSEAFDTPQQALDWLKQSLSTATLPDRIEPR
jgi:hypothetical protein